MNLKKYLDSPRPTTLPNWKGDEIPVRYPDGPTLARCGSAFLIQQTRDTYAVIYGLEILTGLTRYNAAKSFGNACIHQVECESLTIE